MLALLHCVQAVVVCCFFPEVVCVTKMEWMMVMMATAWEQVLQHLPPEAGLAPWM
jgi:hypothetical protein